MTQLFDPVETRIVSIMEKAYDPSGSGRTLAAWRFRRSIDNMPLRDPRYEMGSFDRAYELEWASSQDFPEPENQYDGVSLLEVMLNLNVGYVYGVGASKDVNTSGAESGATSALNARKRALGDAESIKRALTFGGTFSGDLGNGIGWAMCERNGPSQIQDLGGGKLLCVSVFRLLIQKSNTTAYDP